MPAHMYSLIVSISYIEISIFQVPNASPTAASASSDLYGAAVLDACEQIKARMKPIASSRNYSSFTEVSVAMLEYATLCSFHFPF